MMAQTLGLVALFVVLLALLPAGIKWLQRRSGLLGLPAMGPASRVVSAVAVGPHQRVVTVEVGPEAARVWLVLGVTNQAVTCLHSLPVGGAVPGTTLPAGGAQGVP
jgi:flagellar protein FliO/FliZ